MRIDQQELTALITPIMEAMGYVVWHLELKQIKNKGLLRITVDLSPGSKRNGVTVSDCSLISNQVGALLDVEAPDLGSYTLEVSSPGLDRALYGIEHYKRYLGKMIKIVLRQAINGQYNFVGKIQAVNEQELILFISNEPVVFGLTNIGKANLVPDF